jgi:hypothetical protein
VGKNWQIWQGPQSIKIVKIPSQEIIRKHYNIDFIDTGEEIGKQRSFDINR